MRVRCVKAFRDFGAGLVRSEGEEFEVTPDRFDAINGTRYGTLVEAMEDPDAAEKPEEGNMSEGGEDGAQKRPQRRKTARQ
jgi:hypothetical protein